jgi:hypothetical protein
MKTISANEKLDAIIASVEKSGIKAAKLIENLKDLLTDSTSRLFIKLFLNQEKFSNKKTIS